MQVDHFVQILSRCKEIGKEMQKSWEGNNKATKQINTISRPSPLPWLNVIVNFTFPSNAKGFHFAQYKRELNNKS